MSPEFTSLAGEYKKALLLRNLQRRTIAEAFRKIGEFFDYLASQGITGVEMVTKEVIRGYQAELWQTLNQHGRPNSAAYQNSLLGAVKLFMKFLKANDYIVSDPAADIPSPMRRRPIDFPATS